jgi:hypothetical protein
LSTVCITGENKDRILIPYGETGDYEKKQGYHIDIAEFFAL